MPSRNGRVAYRRIDTDRVWVLLYDYDVGKVALKANHRRLLETIAPLLGISAQVHVSFEGHASQTGSEKLNQDLSQLRADTAMAYLKYRAPRTITMSVARDKSGDIVMFMRPPPLYDSTATGERNLVSKNEVIRDRIPPGPSRREDDRDRSVVVKVNWHDLQRVVTITPDAWDEAFELAFSLAGVDTFVLSGGAMSLATTTPAPTNLVDAVKSLLIATAASGGSPPPSEEEIGRMLKEQTIHRMMEAVRRQNLDVTKEEVERRYEDWAKRMSEKHNRNR